MTPPLLGRTVSPHAADSMNTVEELQRVLSVSLTLATEPGQTAPGEIQDTQLNLTFRKTMTYSSVSTFQIFPGAYLR